jgi:hypothetical protein
MKFLECYDTAAHDSQTFTHRGRQVDASVLCHLDYDAHEPILSACDLSDRFNAMSPKGEATPMIKNGDFTSLDQIPLQQYKSAAADNLADFRWHGFVRRNRLLVRL